MNRFFTIAVIVGLALSVAVARPTPAAPVDRAVIRFWKTVGAKAFDGTVRSLSTKDTTTGEESVRLFLRDAPSPVVEDLARMTMHYVLNPPPAPLRLCSGTVVSDPLACCVDGATSSVRPSVDCLEQLRGTQSPTNLLAFTGSLIYLFSQELARSSFVVRSTAGGTLPGNHVLFEWSGPNEDGSFGRGHLFLFTRFDADLIDRIVTTVAAVLPAIQSVRSSTEGSVVGCRGTGYVVIREPVIEPTIATLRVSRDAPARLIKPPMLVREYRSSVELSLHPGAASLRVLPYSTAAAGGRDSALIRFAKEVAAQDVSPFPCERDDVWNAFAVASNQLNHPETSVMFFYALYLKGVWSANGLSKLTSVEGRN
jgi:hypothetical protein